jgi:NitT/TauT family transport system substrate-binding protein
MQLGSAPIYLAQEAGYFQREGLNVQVEVGGGSSVSIPLLAGGKADVSMGSLTPQLFNAMARGGRLRIVAARARYARGCPDENRIYGSRQAFPNGFTDVRQIKGKRVAVSSRIGMTNFAFHKALQYAKLRPADFTQVTMEGREAAALLTAGKVDVSFGGNELFLNSAIGDRVVHGPRFSVFLPDMVHAYLFFGKRLLEEAPDDGVRFLRAALHGQRDYAAGANARFLTDYAKKNGLDEAHVHSRCRAEICEDGEIRDDEIQQFIDWAVGEGHITAPMRATDSGDRRFLKAAKNG